MASARDYNFFQSEAFASGKKHEFGVPKDSGALPEKTSRKILTSNDNQEPFTSADARYQTGIIGETSMKTLGAPVRTGNKVGAKESPSVGTSAPSIAPSITPNILEVRVSHKHFGKAISEKHTPAPISQTTPEQQIEQDNTAEMDSSDNDDENRAKPPYESARKRADKAAFSEW